MPRPHPTSPALRVIRFTRRIALQCARPGWAVPDWAVCDAIANGSRRPSKRAASRGGTVYLFEKKVPDDLLRALPPGANPEVRVLGELTRDGCLALLLLSPLPPRKRISEISGFLNRADSK